MGKTGAISQSFNHARLQDRMAPVSYATEDNGRKWSIWRSLMGPSHTAPSHGGSSISYPHLKLVFVGASIQ